MCSGEVERSDFRKLIGSAAQSGAYKSMIHISHKMDKLIASL